MGIERRAPTDVTVVVVSYNSERCIEQALRPLLGLYEIVVWDNSSTDRTCNLVASMGPQVKLMRSKENLGFARAVNAAVRAADIESACILLLNPDAQIDPISVETMRERLARQQFTSIVGPATLVKGGRVGILEAGREPTLWRVFCHWSGLSLVGIGPIFEGVHLRPRDAEQGREVDWVSGSCLLIRSTTWLELGGLTERWFMYAEDTDLCLRAKRAGHGVYYEPLAKALHELGESSGRSTTVRSDWILNLFELYSTDIAKNNIQRVLWKTVVIYGLLARSLAKFVLRPIGDGSVEFRREAKSNLIHAWRLMRVSYRPPVD